MAGDLMSDPSTPNSETSTPLPPNSILARLRDIPWETYEHAYGAAEDLPDIILAVARGEDDGDDLFSKIHHQRTVFSATAVAVPFVVGAIDANLAAGRTKNAWSLIYSLGLVTNGAGYQQVHHRMFGDRDPVELEKTLAREEQEVTDAHLAACQAAPSLISLLSHQEPLIRQTVLYTLGHCAGVGRTLFPILLRHWHAEKDSTTRALALYSLDWLLEALRPGAFPYMDHQQWPAPIRSEDKSVCVSELTKALHRSIEDGAGLERWIAADVFVRLGGTPTLSPGELAQAWDQAEPDLEIWDEFRSTDWFHEAPPLRIAVAEARLLHRAGYYRSALLDIDAIAQSRQWRGEAIAALVRTLRHEDEQCRFEAASFLRHTGLALRNHLSTLLEAGRADIRLRALLLRPLRLNATNNSAPVRDWVEAVLTGGDDTALLYLVETIKAGDPLHWAGFITEQLNRLLKGGVFRPTTDLPSHAYWHSNRRSGSGLTEDRDNLIDGLVRALGILRGSDIDIDLITEVAGISNPAAIKLLGDMAITDLRARTALESCLKRPALSDSAYQDVRKILRNLTPEGRSFMIAEAGDRPNEELAVLLGEDAEALVPRWRVLLNEVDDYGWRPLTAAKALWTLHGDPHEIRDALVANLSTRPSCLPTLELLDKLGAAATAAVPKLRALRDGRAIIGSSIEQDEQALALIGKLLDRLPV